MIHKSLLLQLKMRAAHKRLLSGVTPTTPKAECEKLLCDYLDAYLAWDIAHGWNKIFNWNNWQAHGFPYGPILNGNLAAKLRKNLGNDPEVNAFFTQVAKTLSTKYDTGIVQQGCIEPLKSAVFAAKPKKTEAK